MSRMDSQLLVLLVLAFSKSCVHGDASVNPGSSSQHSCYCLEEVVDKLHGPVSATFLKVKEQTIVLVTEQKGLVRKFDMLGKPLGTFMDIKDNVNYDGQRGLLSMVLDPLFEVTQRVYVYYIRTDEGKDYAYVSKFKVGPGLVVDKASEQFLLRVYQPYTDGNGGPMLFGDDGYLYIVTGDGGGDDDPNEYAQKKNTFHGKVLRLDVDGQQEFTSGDSGVAKVYGIPPDNPFLADVDALPEVFALGVRNMWGCSIDSVGKPGGTGRIFCAETGTNKSDEIDIIKSGKNYGWNIYEGLACREPTLCAQFDNSSSHEVPIYEFAHTASHALVGGYVYRGKLMPHMTGFYIFGDVMTGKLHSLEEKNGQWVKHDFPPCELKQCPTDAKDQGLSYVLGFSQDLKGEVYVMMTSDFASDSAKMFTIVGPKGTSTQLQASITMIACFVLMVYSLRSTQLLSLS